MNPKIAKQPLLDKHARKRVGFGFSDLVDQLSIDQVIPPALKPAHRRELFDFLPRPFLAGKESSEGAAIGSNSAVGILRYSRLVHDSARPQAIMIEHACKRTSGGIQLKSS